MPPTRFAILLVKFNDNAVEPYPRSFYEDLFTAAGAGGSQRNLVDYWAENSHGKLLFGESRVHGWFTMPKALSDYVGSGANGQGREDLIAWARSAAMAAGVDLTPASAGGYYDGVVVCTNVEADLFGRPGAAVFPPNAMNMTIVAHEVGHALGLNHSRVLGSETDYMDPWDVMSAYACYDTPHPRWSIMGPGLNAANMDARSWLDWSRIWWMPLSLVVGSKPVAWEFTLRPLHRTNLSGFVAAAIDNRFFEFRIKEHWDAGIPSPVVLVHDRAYGYSYLVPEDAGQYAMTVGHTLSWRSSGNLRLKVTVLAIDLAQRKARLHLSAMPLRQAIPRSAVFISPGVRAGANGWAIVGGRKVPVPPKSPLYPVLQHVALHELNEQSPDARVRESGERQALEAISRHVSSVLAKMDEPKVPAPRETRSRTKRTVTRKRKTAKRRS